MNWFIIVFFIISIILYLVTNYFRLKKDLEVEEIEEFENELELTISEKLLKYHDITVNYLDAAEASNLIKKDGDYLKGMNQANLSARDCNSLDELYTKYNLCKVNVHSLFGVNPRQKSVKGWSLIKDQVNHRNLTLPT